MSLSVEEVVLIRESFQKVSARGSQLAALFYARLWEIAPETKVFFVNTNMVEQGRKLWQTLAYVFASLDDFETVKIAARNLGQRHASYGVKKEQYDSVGEALIWTLREELGSEGFTPQLEAVWRKVYGIIVGEVALAYEGSLD